jgi:hypothetical protein
MDCHTEDTKIEGGSLTVYFKHKAMQKYEVKNVPFFTSAPVQTFFHAPAQVPLRHI